MKLLGKVSGWARRGVLAVGALLMTLVALIATTATAHAGLDDELTLVDGKGRLLRIQQWDTFLNGLGQPFFDRVVRQHNQEVHDRRDQDEVDGRGHQDVEVQILPAADADLERRVIRIRARANPIDQRLNDGVTELGDQCGEGRSDDHRNREVNDVATQQKISESLKHDPTLTEGQRYRLH